MSASLYPRAHHFLYRGPKKAAMVTVMGVIHGTKVHDPSNLAMAMAECPNYQRRGQHWALHMVKPTFHLKASWSYQIPATLKKPVIYLSQDDLLDLGLSSLPIIPWPAPPFKSLQNKSSISLIPCTCCFRPSGLCYDKRGITLGAQKWTPFILPHVLASWGRWHIRMVRYPVKSSTKVPAWG